MKLFHQDNPNIQFHSRSTLDFPQHIHDVLEVVFLHGGSATAVCGNRRYDLAAGDVFLSFPNCAHGYENSRDVVCDVIIVPSASLAGWRSQLTQKMPQTPVLHRSAWEQTDISLLLDMVRPDRQQMSEPVKQGYAMVIAGKLLPIITLKDRNPDADSTLQLLLEYLSEHYREPMNRSELAKAVGYNESYISHVFTEQLGITLKDYITSLRLRDARELLADTDMTVSRISILLGFGSIRSFNRAFAEKVGLSPTQYRFQCNLIDKP